MNEKTLKKAIAINDEMIVVFNRVEELKSALRTIENGWNDHELSIHGGMHIITFDPWVVEKMLRLNLKELEEKYLALSAELEKL